MGWRVLTRGVRCLRLYAVFEYGAPAIAFAYRVKRCSRRFEVAIIASKDHGIEPLPTMQRVLSSSRLID